MSDAVFQIHPSVSADNFDYLLGLKSDSRLTMTAVINLIIGRARELGWTVSMSEMSPEGDS